MLNSDALGKKGESHFRLMCSDADLVFNASQDWDKAGWDFVIDFPMPVNERRSLDNRGSPPTCRVQQKTVMESTPSVTLSLKMAERLAKDLSPSFISVFKISEALELASAYLIHIAGDRLAAILKRLRELGHDASDEDMKGKTISFSPTEKERIAVTGAALVERLRTLIGDDIHGYTAKKKKELDELGYGNDAYASRFEVNAEDLQAFSNMFLGLVSQVEVRNIVVTENRFGISIVDSSSETAVMSVEHASTRQCTAVFADEEIGERLVFRGTARITPPGLARKMRLQFQWFSVFMDINSAENKLSFTLTPGEAGGTVDEWLNYWRAMKLVKARRGTVRLGIDGNPNVGELPMLPRERGSPYEDFDDLFDAFETLGLITRRGGLADEASFRFQEVAEAEHDLARVRALLDGATKSIKNRALGDLSEVPQLPDRMLYANGVKVGEHVIAYCVVGTPVYTPKRNAVGIKLIGLSLPLFSAVDSAASYQAFIDSHMAKAKVTAVMAAKPLE